MKSVLHFGSGSEFLQEDLDNFEQILLERRDKQRNQLLKKWKYGTDIMIIIDTHILIGIERGEISIKLFIENNKIEDFYISTISIQEL